MTTNSTLQMLGFVYRHLRDFQSVTPMDTIQVVYSTKREYCFIICLRPIVNMNIMFEVVQFKYVKLEYFISNDTIPNDVSYFELLSEYCLQIDLAILLLTNHRK